MKLAEAIRIQDIFRSIHDSQSLGIAKDKCLIAISMIDRMVDSYLLPDPVDPVPTPTPTNPTAPQVPPNYPVEMDFGEGGGQVFRKYVQPGETSIVAFTVVANKVPKLAVFPGSGKFYSQIEDQYPWVYDGPPRSALIGNNADYAEIPAVIANNPGRYYYAFSVNKAGTICCQYTQDFKS